LLSSSPSSPSKRQRGISGGGTINNQLKALAATALETATIKATLTTIKTKATVRRAARRDRGCGGSLTSAWRQRQRSGGGG
jgi:hypothetical protein